MRNNDRWGRKFFKGNYERVSEHKFCYCTVFNSFNSILRQIKTLISANEAKGDWTFLYIGENPDRWSKETGMAMNRGMAYGHERPRANFMSAALGVGNFRRQPARQAAPSLNLFEVQDPK